MHTLRVLLYKEFRQFFRSRFLPKMVIIFPLLVMLVIPWVTTLDVHHITVTIIDNDHTTASRRIAEKIGASDYFTLQPYAPDYLHAMKGLESGHTDVIVEIPDDFEHDLSLGTPKRISLSSNGVNAMKGSLGMQYVTQVVMETYSQLSQERGLTTSPDPITVENRYNPTLEYRFYMIPALMIMLIIMICGFLPALNLVSEKESGTIEQINVTPVSRFTFALSKLIPFWIIGLLVLTLAMFLAWLVYGLTPIGSPAAIYLGAILFIFTMSGIGVTSANFSENMQQTMFALSFFIMLFILMSGLITPIKSMPEWAQWITRFLPPRYFIDIMRSVYLKGTTMLELGMNYVILAAFAVVFDLLAAVTYHKQA